MGDNFIPSMKSQNGMFWMVHWWGCRVTQALNHNKSFCFTAKGTQWTPTNKKSFHLEDRLLRWNGTQTQLKFIHNWVVNMSSLLLTLVKPETELGLSSPKLKPRNLKTFVIDTLWITKRNKTKTMCITSSKEEKNPHNWCMLHNCSRFTLDTPI
jgi:hypothetical protein